MPHVKSILVPIETREKNADPIVTWAALWARTLGSRLILLHVNEGEAPWRTDPSFGSSETKAPAPADQGAHADEQAARTELARLVQHYCGGVTADSLVLAGRTPAVILGAIESTACDLVVVGTHARPWHQRLLLGSTAEAVLRTSTVPVLIVRNTAPVSSPVRLTRLLFPTDFSTASAAGEEWARMLASHGVKDIVLVHVVENPLLDVYEPDTAAFDLQRLMEESRQHPPRSAKPYWEHAYGVAQGKLSALRQQLFGAPAHASRVDIQVSEGPTAESILAIAREQAADVIVMATHGRTGVRRLMLGSVTEKVIRTAMCPLLAVPSTDL
jgi:nucleotide-binding universal stress UspA family protein